MPIDRLPPDAIEFLKNHESNDEHDILQDPTKLVLDLTDPTTQSLLANANRAAELEARERKLKAAERLASAKDAFRRAKARSVPQKIGLTGIDPRSGFDCRFDPATRTLRIHTDRGSDLILMRLSDAVEELEGLEGAQTHRSWWVAREAVRAVERGDGRATLTLDGGLSAPVSRRYARMLRDAEWW